MLVSSCALRILAALFMIHNSSGTKPHKSFLSGEFMNSSHVWLEERRDEQKADEGPNEWPRFHHHNESYEADMLRGLEPTDVLGSSRPVRVRLFLQQ
ncbi:hypothetical protein TNCT_23491 [Trichonephila clavata]|uniref:Secreted protein n=1 Tax=Trichonephila clavata TaxID=2740835 RepID=A0A8X6H6I3_TRICU|nr:hypothetical protein TNCT_23491 [Trichonephila clavata]